MGAMQAGLRATPSRAQGIPPHTPESQGGGVSGDGTTPMCTKHRGFLIGVLVGSGV